MTFVALIKKGGLTRAMTATLATPAIQQPAMPTTVAPVAVATLAELSQGEEANIRARLAHIEESDPATIEQVLVKCRDNLTARAYCLKQWEEVPKPAADNRIVTCSDCIDFQRMDHPYLGHCAMGEPEAIAGLCATDRRYCEHFSPKP